eukprot:1988882-Alexandrium_andersonii.AAC.1
MSVDAGMVCSMLLSHVLRHPCQVWYACSWRSLQFGRNMKHLACTVYTTNRAIVVRVGMQRR